MKLSSLIGLERPLFGQCVRQIVGLRSELLDECLAHQHVAGGRLGEIMRSRGLITQKQLIEVLRFQARWVASAMQADMRPQPFPPYSGFLSLCLPAYNEQCNIRDTLDAACAILPEFIDKFEVVVVDDGSKDATAEMVSEFSRHDQRVRLIRHDTNRGYGAAVTTGLRAARGDLIAFTDSDGQFSFLDLAQLLVLIKDADVAVGYRYQRADHWIRSMNAGAWNWLIRILLGVKIQDLDCAFKLFRRSVIDNLQLTSTGAAINAEIMAQCCHANLLIHETPVTHYPRYYGAPSGAAFKVICRAFRELPSLWKYRTAPMAAPLAPADVGVIPLEAVQVPVRPVKVAPRLEVGSSAVPSRVLTYAPTMNGHTPAATLPG